MKTTQISRTSVAAFVVAITLATVGLLGASLAVSWIAGCLSISYAAASQITDAIEIGGWALAAIGFVFGAGIAGALIATTQRIILRAGRAQAVA